MKKIRRTFWLWLLVPCFTFTSCDEETFDTVLEVIDEIFNMLGYNMEDEDISDEETADVIEDEVSDTRVNWESKFPPINSQGSYGTCVAWATGYNMKTALNVIDGTWDSPSSSSHQCSPVDLWHLIPSSGKSTNCNGSYFDPTFETMISNGVATMSQVPFTNSKMTCDGVSGKGSSLRLGKFRVVAYSSELGGSDSYGMTVNNIKNYLKQGPLVIGAKLGDKFMDWNSSNPIKSDNDTYNGQHAHHAMALVGFDDSKNAFRLRNSWGDDWGDEGSIWVDYNFFVSGFCFGVWSASNPTTSASLKTSKPDSDNVLKVSVLSDSENQDGSRTVTFELTNQSASSINVADYPVIYLLFKEKRLAQRSILFEMNENEVIAAKTSKTFTRTYQVPANLSDGSYYLALIADPYNVNGKVTRTNSFAFVANENNLPLTLTAGKISGVNGDVHSEIRTIVSEANPNAYTNAEIETSLIRANKK